MASNHAGSSPRDRCRRYRVGSKKPGQFAGPQTDSRAGPRGDGAYADPDRHSGPYLHSAANVGAGDCYAARYPRPSNGSADDGCAGDRRSSDGSATYDRADRRAAADAGSQTNCRGSSARPGA